jgi:hypothetical protein
MTYFMKTSENLQQCPAGGFFVFAYEKAASGGLIRSRGDGAWQQSGRGPFFERANLATPFVRLRRLPTTVQARRARDGHRPPCPERSARHRKMVYPQVSMMADGFPGRTDKISEEPYVGLAAFWHQNS